MLIEEISYVLKRLSLSSMTFQADRDLICFFEEKKSVHTSVHSAVSCVYHTVKENQYHMSASATCYLVTSCMYHIIVENELLMHLPCTWFLYVQYNHWKLVSHMLLHIHDFLDVPYNHWKSVSDIIHVPNNQRKREPQDCTTKHSMSSTTELKCFQSQLHLFMSY
jgi:hypothetical protein